MASSKSYKTSDPFRGLMVIINNINFATVDLRKRVGSEIDVERLKGTFGQLGFDIRTYEDRTCDQMCRDIKAVAHSKDLSKYDCLVVVLSTHGDEGNIIHGVGPGNDSCPLDRVLQPLKDIKKKKEQGTEKAMPKLVFVQACRGTNLDEGHNVQEDEVDARNDNMDTDCIRVPIEADFLYHYATCPGYYSFRNTTDGSIFIRTICDVYDECINKGAEIDVLKSHLEVNGRVAKNYKSGSLKDPAFHNKKQMPSFVCMLRKNLFLKKQIA